MIENPAAAEASTSRRKALPAGLAAILGLALPTAHAVTFVTNCNDAGLGSLRSSMSATEEGGIVDLRGLTTDSPGCTQSTITLTTGDIPVFQDNVKILGPGENFVVSGRNGKYSVQPYRIFTHTGSGTFEIDDLSMNEGYAVGTGELAEGGCILSKGNLALKHVTMAFCYAKATSGASLGGAVFGSGDVSLYYSTMLFNHADGQNGATSRGGAVAVAGGAFYMYASNISNNSVGSEGHADGIGGGIETNGTSTCDLENSTVSGNRAAGNGGAFGLFCTEAAIVNSTMSGNSATFNGGAYIRSPRIELYNSTVAFNSSTSTSPSPGLRMVVNGAGTTASMHSMLVSNNTYGPTNLPNDLFGAVVVGSNNLIFTPGSSVPADTIVGKCPLLAPLADNGGPTQTHALRSTSPAIDKGINTLALTTDQRGGSFVRESGPPGAATPLADIGAFELNRSVAIFSAGFDGCP